ncbi:TonB-dependent siderophore receptor [Ottowia sp.]|uniref:TonB-dependent siderophore receptor n=1 Tax=Ottowia sp. TaxID=1898956 RepID=UPI0039E59828
MSRHQAHRHSAAPRPLALAAHLLLAGGIAAGCWAAPARAQPAAPASPGQGVENTRSYSIPAGPLNAVLVRFLSESGVLLSGSTELAQGRNSPGVHGRFTPGAALGALLAGTGLDAVPDAQGRYVLRPAAPKPESGPAANEAAATLAEVKVTAQAVRDGTTEGTGSYTTDITRTATGLALSPRETPQSVTVVTRQQMDDQAAAAVQDALQSTTGVSVQALDRGRNQVYARGFSIENFQIDGLPTVSGNVGIETGSTVIYDRVEVVRGATGLLNGTGEPSATVNLVRKRADSKAFTGSVAAELGSWSHGALTADLSTPLNADGSVRGRLVAHGMKENSFMDRESRRDTVLYGVVEADLTPATRLSVGASQEVIQRRGVYWGGLTYWFSDGTRTDWPRSTNNGAGWNRWDTDERTAFARLEHTFDNRWKLRADLGYYSKKEDIVALYMSGVPDRVTGLGYEPYPASFGYEPQTQKQFAVSASGPFQLWGREHELLLGAMRTSHRFGLNVQYGLDPAPIGNFYLWNGDYPMPIFEDRFATDLSTTTRTNAYAATRLQLADSLKLILGAQWTQWTLDTEIALWRSTEPYTVSKKVFVPYGGLVYDLNRNVSLYGSYTKIFNPQTAKDRYGSYLDPVEGRGVEVGVKGEFLDGRLNASAAVFRIDQNNVATPDEGYVVPGTTQTASRAVKGARSQGVELEVAGEVAPGWQLGAGWTRYRARDAQGEEVNAQHPRQLLKLFTKYEFRGALAGLAVGGGLAWQSTPPFTQTNPATGLAERVGQPAYTLVDLMASYRFNRQTSVQLNIRNVFDKKYYYAPWDSPTYGAPRSFTVQLKHTF